MNIKHKPKSISDCDASGKDESDERIYKLMSFLFNIHSKQRLGDLSN